MMLTKTQEIKISKNPSLQKLKKSNQLAILLAGQKLRVYREQGTGKRTCYKENFNYSELQTQLNAIGLPFEYGNDAPRGGKLGDFLRLLSKPEIRILKQKERLCEIEKTIQKLFHLETFKMVKFPFEYQETGKNYKIDGFPSDIPTFQDFHQSTNATFTLCAEPTTTADFVSFNKRTEEISSKYWYGEDEQGSYVIRYSDHWSNRVGYIRTCYWILDGTEDSTEFICGKCYLKDFTIILQVR